jgi:hypothetical protein
MEGPAHQEEEDGVEHAADAGDDAADASEALKGRR